MRPSRPRPDESMRTSYPGAGGPQDARDAGPTRERRASRCRSRGPLHRPCGSWATWVCAVSDAPSRPERRARLQRTSARPTSSKGISTRSDRTSCGSPTFPHCVGGPPSYVRAFSGWVYVAFVTDVFSRRIIGWRNHLPASVHRPGPGRPSDGRLATKANRGRPDGPGASLATAARKYRSIRYGQALSECEAVASVGSRATPFGFALAEALKLLVQG